MTKVADIPWFNLNDPNIQFAKSVNEQLEASQWFDESKIKEEATADIRQLLNYCQQKVPYYQKIFSGLDWEDLDSISLDDFEKFPTLTKPIIRDNTEDLISQDFINNTQNLGRFDTSGSTGIPTTVYRGRQNLAFTRALSLRYHLWHNRDFSLKNVSIMTLGREENDKPGNWANGVKTGQGYSLDISQESSKLYTKLLKLQPNYIQTHPSTLNRLIDISLTENRFLTELKEVRSFGELLEPSIREKCLEHWKVPVTDMYSCEETGAMAFQCPENEHYHVQVENVYMEILNEDKQACAVGEPGKIHITQLKNRAMPLIRYETGDVGEWGESCNCGRKMPVLKKISGRVRNLVALPNGDTFHPVFDEKIILAAVPSIKQYQFIQKSTSLIEVNLVCEEELNATRKSDLSKALNKSFRHEFEYHFVQLENITYSNRNKFEIFKSEISHS